MQNASHSGSMQSRGTRGTKFAETGGVQGTNPRMTAVGEEKVHVTKVDSLEGAFAQISKDLDKGVRYPPDQPLSARFKIHHPGQEARSEEEDRKLTIVEEEFLRKEGFLTGISAVDMIHYFLYKDCAEIRKFYDYIMDKKLRKKRVSEDDRDRCRAFITRLQKVTEKCEYIVEPKDQGLPAGYGLRVMQILVENLQVLPLSLREIEEYISGKGSKREEDMDMMMMGGPTQGSVSLTNKPDVSPMDWTHRDAAAFQDDGFNWEPVLHGPRPLENLVTTFLSKERSLVTNDPESDGQQTWQKVLLSLRTCFSTSVPNFRYLPEISFSMELLGDQSQLTTEAARIVDDAPRNVAYVVILTNKSSNHLYVGLKILNNKWPTDFRPVGSDRCDFTRANGKVGTYKRTMCSQGVTVPKHSQMAIYVTVRIPEDSEPGQSDTSYLVATWLAEPRRCSAYVRMVTGRFEVPSSDEEYDSEEEWHREMQSAAVTELFKRFGPDLRAQQEKAQRKSHGASRAESRLPSRGSRLPTDGLETLPSPVNTSPTKRQDSTASGYGRK